MDDPAPDAASTNTPDTHATPPARLALLDVLRGVALLGILPVNILFFALPIDEATEAPAGGGAVQGLAYAVTRVLFEYKFITLFSTLFGGGLVLLRRKWERTGRGFGWPILRRLGFLGVVGGLHAVFLWYGDVLAHYAIVGVTWCAATAWRPRTQLRVGLVLLGVPVLIGLLGWPVLLALEQDPDLRPVLDELMKPSDEGFVPGSTQRSWGEFFTSLEHLGSALEREVFGEGRYTRMVALRALIWAALGVPSLALIGWRVAGSFLVGMAWVSSGLSASAAGQRAHVGRVLTWGLALGLPLELAGLWLGWRTGRLSAWWGAETLHYAGSMGLAAAYGGLVAWWAIEGKGARAAARVAALGRTAFTNYLLQSAVCTSVFYAYGGGLFGRFDHLQLWGVVLLMWTVQLAAAPLWLKAFGAGPVEWVWRRATGDPGGS